MITLRDFDNICRDITTKHPYYATTKVIKLVFRRLKIAFNNIAIRPIILPFLFNFFEIKIIHNYKLSEILEIFFAPLILLISYQY